MNTGVSQTAVVLAACSVFAVLIISMLFSQKDQRDHEYRMKQLELKCPAPVTPSTLRPEVLT